MEETERPSFGFRKRTLALIAAVIVGSGIVGTLVGLFGLLD